MRSRFEPPVLPAVPRRLLEASRPLSSTQAAVSVLRQDTRHPLIQCFRLIRDPEHLCVAHWAGCLPVSNEGRPTIDLVLSQTILLMPQSFRRDCRFFAFQSLLFERIRRRLVKCAHGNEIFLGGRGLATSRSRKMSPSRGRFSKRGAGLCPAARFPTG